MEDPPLTCLTPSMLHFWAFEFDQLSRDEMIKLHPKRDQVVTVTIEDINLDPPSSFSSTNHDNYLSQLKNTLYERAFERQEFNFHLSESRTTRFGGSRIQVVNSAPSAAGIGHTVSTVTPRGDGMAIGLNWRLPRAVNIRLPRDIAMAARYSHMYICSSLFHLVLFST